MTLKLQKNAGSSRPWSSIALAVSLVVVLAAGANAHDYWLAQAPGSIAPGDECTIRLFVGDEMDPELSRPLQYEWTSRYEWHTANTTRDLLETTPDQAIPVFAQTMATAGLSLIAMDRDFVGIATTVGGFLNFLEHEGQNELAAQYKNTSPETPLTRRYARSIKTLVRVGKPTTKGPYDKVIGQDLEVRLLQAPHTLAMGTTITAHIQFKSKDLSAALVRAMVKEPDGTFSLQEVRTDASGQVEFDLDRPGSWVIRVTHLRQCQDCEVDWDTHYATYSFVLP